MFDWLNGHEPNVQTSIKTLIQNRYTSLLAAKLDRCQSPIQKILLAYLEGTPYTPYFPDDPLILITFDVEVKLPSLDPNYLFRKPDILATILYASRIDGEKRIFKYIIECDGHENHSTREDMNRDYKRKREMELQGYHVLSWTGSEIVRNPTGCAEEFFQIVAQKLY